MKKVCHGCGASIPYHGPPRCTACAYERPDGQDIRRRRRAYLAAHPRCVECGATDNLTVDHVTALANGGRDHESNFQTLCRACNGRKRDL